MKNGGSTIGRKCVDWQDVHRRLERAQAAIESGLSPSGEEKRRVLRTRAETLARDTAERGKPREELSLEVVTFLLAQETYGVELRCVREIFALRGLTPLPGNPRFVAGIVNVRGRILPVIDIKKLFGLPEKGLTDLNKVVVVQAGDLELGILADQILRVRSVSPDLIQPSLPTLTGIREDYLKGVTAERLVILDAQKILTDPRVAEGSAEG